jgi:hypothetical protein
MNVNTTPPDRADHDDEEGAAEAHEPDLDTPGSMEEADRANGEPGAQEPDSDG